MQGDVPALSVLYSDEHLIAVNKPNGLLVHKTKIANDATEFALQIVRNQTKRQVYPVHRLDRGTSGVLLFTFSPQTHAQLSSDFENRKVEKSYLAVVRGFTDDVGRIDHALRKDMYSPRQEAVTEYKRLDTIELPNPVGKYATARYSLVKVHPLTGRMHQIRKHFNHINHPVIGDLPHGDYRHNHFFRDEFNCPFLLLHSHQLQFTHPVTQTLLTVDAPLLEPMSNILLRFGWVFDV